MRVLVADDSSVIRKSVENILTQNGYEVVTTKDGAEAWDTLKDGAIRLAVMDWEIPHLNGPEVCTKLKKLFLNTHRLSFRAQMTQAARSWKA